MTPPPVTIRAEFDGKVIVPLEPLHLPPKSLLNLTIALSAESNSKQTETSLVEKRAILDRIVQRANPGANLPAEALRRENMYDDE